MNRKKSTLSGEKEIQAEYDRLMQYYQKIPENELAVATELIRNAAFLSVTLRRLQRIICESDLSEEYQNGKDQSGRKCSA